MTTKMGTKLLLMVTALVLMAIPMCSTGVKADETVGPTQRVEFAPSEPEKTILSTILKSFKKNGEVDLITLASALNDPNLDRLVASLSKANLTKLANVLDGKHMDLGKLVVALSDPELNLEEALRTFRDPRILPPTTLKGSVDAGLMSTMKNWGDQISATLKDYHRGTTIPPSDDTNAEGTQTDDAAIKESIVKQDAEFAKIVRDVEKANDGIPAGFERSTPNPNANTYGKSLMDSDGGMVTTTGSGPSIKTEKTEDSNQRTAEESSQSTLNDRMIYLAVGVVFGLSMLTFLATRFVKAYCADTAEETRNSMLLTA